MTAIELAAQELLDAWDDMASRLNNGHSKENIPAIERLRNAKSDLRAALRGVK
jgi:hypothetical protein